jgi:hypothetical protein
MTNTEQTTNGWRVTTTLPIFILLLHSESEYYNYVFLEVGTADCGCENVVIFETETQVQTYIETNNMTEYTPEITEI